MRLLLRAMPDIVRLIARLVVDPQLPRTANLAKETVLAQLRSVVVDLLQVTGLDVDEAIAALPRERPRE